MLSSLKNRIPNRPKPIEVKKKRILCIIEGDLELRYIVKIFELFGYQNGCYQLTQELIRVAWGDKFLPFQNIVNAKCKFQGGSLKGRKVPIPARDAFEMYRNKMDYFDSVMVFFDGDKDKNNEVENYFKEQFKNLEIKNSLLVSMPCFESTLIDFCRCGECREMMNSFENEKYPCGKYKNNFSKLFCFEGSKHLIVNLDRERLITLHDSKLMDVNNLIDSFMGLRVANV
jgi:hypothetical protein